MAKNLLDDDYGHYYDCGYDCHCSHGYFEEVVVILMPWIVPSMLSLPQCFWGGVARNYQ
jgi:hypothetical protein